MNAAHVKTLLCTFTKSDLFMLSSSSIWAPYLVTTIAAVSVLSIFLLSRKRKNYEKVAKIYKLFFYPVKALKAVEVTKGRCTKFGFEVNGILDRSFMLVDKNGTVVSQKEAPSLVLLTPEITENYLIIKGPDTVDLKLQMKKSPSQDDKIIMGKIDIDSVVGVDCGDEAATWFQSYIKMDGVRLVQFFPSKHMRECTKKNPFRIKIRKNHPATFQNVSAFHVVSKASVDDINSKVDGREISALNFRPNIVVEQCEAFAEDSWEYMKFDSGAEMIHLLMKARCMVTTNDPVKAILDKIEPLRTLRKYRIPADTEVLKKTGRMPCVGICCGVIAPGEIEVGNDVFAVVGKMPKMDIKDM